MSDLVTIQEFSRLIEGHIAKDILEDAGIECFLLDEFSSQLYGGAYSGVRLQVKVEDADKAKKILTQNPISQTE